MHKGVDEKSCREMNQGIREMIPKNIESPEMIIHKEGEVRQKTGRMIFPKEPKIGKAPNQNIFTNMANVIKLERDFEGVRINSETQKGYEEKDQKAEIFLKDHKYL